MQVVRKVLLGMLAFLLGLANTMQFQTAYAYETHAKIAGAFLFSAIIGYMVIYMVEKYSNAKKLWIWRTCFILPTCAFFMLYAFLEGNPFYYAITSMDVIFSIAGTYLFKSNAQNVEV